LTAFIALLGIRVVVVIVIVVYGQQLASKVELFAKFGVALHAQPASWTQVDKFRDVHCRTKLAVKQAHGCVPVLGEAYKAQRVPYVLDGRCSFRLFDLLVGAAVDAKEHFRHAGGNAWKVGEGLHCFSHLAMHV